MKTVNPHRKIKAALKLLEQDKLSPDSFEQIRILLEGIDPKLDARLKSASSAYKDFQKLAHGKYIDLTLKHIPATTKEEKKRKKALLLFLNSYRQLRSEVSRVHSEFHVHSQNSSINNSVRTLGRLAIGAKGPLGLVTLAAIGIVGVTVLFQKTQMTGMQQIAPPQLLINSDGSNVTPETLARDADPSYWVEEVTLTESGSELIIGAHVHIQSDEIRNKTQHIPAAGAIITLTLSNQNGSTNLTGTIDSTNGWTHITTDLPTNETQIFITDLQGDLPWAPTDRSQWQNQPAAIFTP